jgi:4-amino-4-deoxy-L-arabinose transferase-like glycosyltransferase
MHRKALPGLIVLLAVAVRIAVIAADEGYSPANDSFEYDYYARSIAAGEGYPRSGYLLYGGPTAVRGPGYPYFLGAVYSVSADSVTAGRLAGALLGGLAVLLLYLLASRIWGRRAGLLAAALAAVFPPLVLLSRELLSESLFIVLELAALLCVLNFRRSGGELRWALAAGALCGLAVLTRNIGVILLLGVALGLWSLRPRLAGRAVLPPVLAVICAALVVLPWTLRNAAEFGRFIPVTTSAGLTSAGIYNQSSLDKSRHGGTPGSWRFPQQIAEDAGLFTNPSLDEGDVDATLRRRAREFALDHPGYVAEASAWNLLRLFEIVGGSVVDVEGRPLNDRGIGSATRTVDRIGLALGAALAMVGVIAIVRSRRKVEPGAGETRRIPHGPLYLWLVPILMIVTAAPLGGLPRYRLPADPFLLILAAIGLAYLWDRITPGNKEAA